MTAVLAYLKTIGSDWLARMTGPLSLVLLFVPFAVPRFSHSALVWIVAFICLTVSTYRAWLSEHRVRSAEKLDPLIEAIGQLHKLWDDIQYDHKDSDSIRFPLAPFSVERWTEVHKQLLRLYFWTALESQRLTSCFAELGIAERPRLTDVMNEQNSRRSLNALGYTRLLDDCADLLTRHRARIAG